MRKHMASKQAIIGCLMLSERSLGHVQRVTHFSPMTPARLPTAPS